MKTIECIKSRRSIRKFEDTPVDKKTLESLVEAASYAPSWKNTQVVRYTAVTNASIKERIAKNCVMDFVGNETIIRACPVLIIVSFVHGISGYEKSGESSTSKEDRWEVFDAGVAAQTFCLAAWDKGLGTVIMGVFDAEKVSREAGIPNGETVAALIALGYPGIAPKAPHRKSPEELITWK